MKTRLKHALKCTLLIGLALSTTSCVYLRLNTLRKQLAQFEKYCTFENTVGPAIVFKKPVIKPKDTEWLLGFTPSTIQDEGDTEVRTAMVDLRNDAGYLLELLQRIA